MSRLLGIFRSNEEMRRTGRWNRLSRKKSARGATDSVTISG